MMSEKNAARAHWKKAARMLSALMGRGFNSSKCKTMAKMAVARVKLLRNKREVVIRQMRRDIAMLLDSKQDSTARIRVEHVIREQNIMAANDLIELFCELVVSRLSIISKQRESPPDLKEGISSLIFAAPRCSEIPELVSIQQVFRKKYGKDFVSAATDLRPNAGVNRLLIEKLSVKTPSGETKLKVLKDIAKEYQVQWDTAESEAELLKPPEERIEGPNAFVSGSSLPLKPDHNRSLETNNAAKSEPKDAVNVQELVSAVGIAAEKALAAVEAAASLAHGGSSTRRHSLNSNNASGNSNGEYYSTRRKSDGQRMKKSNDNYTIDDDDEQQSVCDNNGKISRRRSYNSQVGGGGTRSSNIIKFDEESDYDEEIEVEKPVKASREKREKFNRRHSGNDRPGVRYDEYDDDGDDDGDEWGHRNRGGNNGPPPERRAPNVPVQQRVHPKLPDYDALAARFEALKNHKG